MEDMEGKLVKIEGRVTGSQPMSVSWFKDSSEIYSSDKYDISFKSNVAVLCIKSSKMADSGRYSCQASNEAGKASCDVTVGILGRFVLQSFHVWRKMFKPQWNKSVAIFESILNIFEF